jgi:hypothetical protein
MRGFEVWAVHANGIPLPAGRFIHLLNGRVQVKALRRTDPPHLRSPTICLNRICENSTTKEKETGICGVTKTTETTFGWKIWRLRKKDSCTEALRYLSLYKSICII